MLHTFQLLGILLHNDIILPISASILCNWFWFNTVNKSWFNWQINRVLLKYQLLSCKILFVALNIYWNSRLVFQSISSLHLQNVIYRFITFMVLYSIIKPYNSFFVINRHIARQNFILNDPFSGGRNPGKIFKFTS